MTWQAKTQCLLPAIARGYFTADSQKYKTLKKIYRVSTDNRRTDDLDYLLIVFLLKNFQGYKIMAATCSQEGADVAVLQTELDLETTRRTYHCKCGGIAQADAFKSKNGYITCRLHYWRCPSSST